jgi:5-methylcytosine-specific restriction endonuclease McrA
VLMTVLVLNQNYEPLAVARVPRALTLIGDGKAEVVEHGILPIWTPSCSIPRPSVIRLINYIKRPRPHVRFTRQNVFKRDGYRCMYCGKRPKQLTIDHVLPQSRGGTDAWENVVASCRSCNHRKGARTPEEARMPLKRTPVEPRISSYLHLLGIDTRPEWVPFLPLAAGN